MLAFREMALVAAAIGVVLGAGLHASEATDDPHQKERDRMVARTIEARGVRDPAVLAAMRSVPRGRFVPDNLQRSAHDDAPLPIGHGQTISQPYIVAYMTELVAPGPGDKVLEIGSGSGYQAAVLAQMAGRVFTIEIVPELAARSARVLADLGYANVTVREGDGYFGWPEEAPFDAIVVTAASERIPPPLIEQLRDGGRMIIPVGPPMGTQYLVLVTKSDGAVRTKTLIPVRFVPFTRRQRDASSE